MQADQRTRRSAILWRAVCWVGRALQYIGGKQVYALEAWSQASRAAVPETGPLAWVRTLDGYQLAGSHLPAGSDLATGGIP
jgi:hypothetical protein